MIKLPVMIRMLRMLLLMPAADASSLQVRYHLPAWLFS